MSLTIAVDDNNDIYIGPSGSMQTATGLQATMQSAQQAAQAQFGEMMYAVDQGVPNFAVIWNGAPNVAQFEASLRRTLLAVKNVTGILDLTTTVSSNTLSYRVEIQTIFGPGVLNG